MSQWIRTKKECRRVITDVERAAAPGGRTLLGAYLIEGSRIHERAIRAGAPLRTVMVSESFLEDQSDRAVQLRSDLEAIDSLERFAVADDEVDRITGGRKIGPLLGLVDFPEDVDLGRLVAHHGKRAAFLVVCEVEDPGNVGALTRTALASGAAALIAVGISDPFHPRAVRTSMGSLFRIPVLRLPSSDSILSEFASHGVLRVGTVTEGGTPLPDVEMRPGPIALFVGREAFGLERGTIDSLDCLVSIPMGSSVDSYSVNAAAAIGLYELIARRDGSD